jgi:hypothetical protein
VSLKECKEIVNDSTFVALMQEVLSDAYSDSTRDMKATGRGVGLLSRIFEALAKKASQCGLTKVSKHTEGGPTAAALQALHPHIKLELQTALQIAGLFTHRPIADLVKLFFKVREDEASAAQEHIDMGLLSGLEAVVTIRRNWISRFTPGVFFIEPEKQNDEEDTPRPRFNRHKSVLWQHGVASATLKGVIGRSFAEKILEQAAFRRQRRTQARDQQSLATEVENSHLVVALPRLCEAIRQDWEVLAVFCGWMQRVGSDRGTLAREDQADEEEQVSSAVTPKDLESNLDAPD